MTNIHIRSILLLHNLQHGWLLYLHRSDCVLRLRLHQHTLCVASNICYGQVWKKKPVAIHVPAHGCVYGCDKLVLSDFGRLELVSP
jgi:hypothetical protein